MTHELLRRVTLKSGLFFNYESASRSLHFAANKERLGGKGITDRYLDEIDGILPGIKKRVFQEEGKIVIPGNGLSDVPCLLAERYQRGKLHERPVILDVFSYPTLLHDLNEINHVFEVNALLPPAQSDVRSLTPIVEYIHSGDLIALQYYFGSGKVPSEAKQANLVINCHGPRLETLDEQLALLAPGGELYCNLQSYNNEHIPDVPSGYQLRENNIGKFKGFIIKRQNE
jgi:hypothetical protein